MQLFTVAMNMSLTMSKQMYQRHVISVRKVCSWSNTECSLIWQKAPKTVYCGRDSIETAVAMAVSNGKTTLASVLKELGILPG